MSAIKAQRLTGVVSNEKGSLLPYTSVMIKGTSIGVSANNNAAYSFNLKPGTYTLVCQHIGYEALEKTISIDADTQLDFVLKPQQLMMQAVIVSSKGENPAYAIIRKAIKKRTFYNSQVDGFSCDLYTKDVI
jgi:hypothetical protein